MYKDSNAVEAYFLFLIEFILKGIIMDYKAIETVSLQMLENLIRKL